MLGDYFTSGEITTEKKLEKGKKKICYIKRPDQIRQVCPLLYSEHKEADHGIVSHAKYANDNDNNENSSITIVADDTDIYILLIRIACYCRSILYFSRDTLPAKKILDIITFQLQQLSLVNQYVKYFHLFMH